VIILDTHIWVWWIHNNARLTGEFREHIRNNEDEGLGVSVFSCWEVAKLVEIRKLTLHCPIDEWDGYSPQLSGHPAARPHAADCD